MKPYPLSSLLETKFSELDTLRYSDNFFTSKENAICPITKEPYFINYLRGLGIKEVDKYLPSIGLPDTNEKIKPGKIKFADVFDLFQDLLQRPVHKKGMLDVFNSFMIEKKGSAHQWAGTNICLSSDPWDIATMSMRGTRSCMAWHSRNSKQLVGSILDPYCSVIYLTDHKILKGEGLTYGHNMLARSVVRVAVDRIRPRNEYLLIEKVYPANKTLSAESLANIACIFKHFLIERKGNYGLGILLPHESKEGLVIRKTTNLPSTYMSCVDSNVPYELAPIYA